MYRCAICKALSRPGDDRRVHVVHRQGVDSQTLLPVTMIHREIPVCQACGGALDSGVPVRDLLKDIGRYTEVKPLPVPVQPPRQVLVGVPAKVGIPSKVG